LNKPFFRPRRPLPPTHNFIINHNIRASKIICIDDENVNLGLIPLDEAIAIAHSRNLDVIMVSPSSKDTAPTCRILDFGKYKYEQEKKEKAVKKKQRENAVRVKEVKLHPSTSDNDLQTKARQMIDFISEGNRVRAAVFFRGRELAHKELGLDTLRKFTKLVGAQFDGEPAMTGKALSVMITKSNEDSRAQVK
jgi:translation initiation factor IF-3